MVRKKVKPMIEERKKAATTIQARLRGYFERKKTKNSKKQQESALKIQRGESGVISLNIFGFFFGFCLFKSIEPQTNISFFR